MAYATTIAVATAMTITMTEPAATATLDVTSIVIVIVVIVAIVVAASLPFRGATQMPQEEKLPSSSPKPPILKRSTQRAAGRDTTEPQRTTGDPHG